jgi:hypothetical protein
MLAGTSRPVGENQAKKRKHRTEVSEATEKVWRAGGKCSRGHRGLPGENQTEKRKHRTEVSEATEKVWRAGRKMLAGTPRLASENQAKEKQVEPLGAAH